MNFFDDDEEDVAAPHNESFFTQADSPAPRQHDYAPQQVRDGAYNDRGSSPAPNRDPTVDRELPPEFGHGQPPDREEPDADEDEGVVKRLVRKWMNERSAPEILDHSEDDVSQCLFLLQKQVSAFF